MAALLAACVAFQLNASMLSPALTTIEHELNTDAAAVGLTQTAFFTSAALFSLFLPRLGDIIGRKKVLSGMLAVMTLGCVIAALAPNINVLFVGRVVQGVSGPVVPLCLIMLRVEVPEPKLYGTLMGVLTAINGGIAGIDALAGGYLAESFGFAAIFWVMAVVAAIATLLMVFLAPESTAGTKERMDWLGVVPLVISVGAALIALNEIGRLSDANWVLVAILVVVAAASFAIFWRVEERSGHPLVATHLLRRRATWALLLTTVLTMTGVFAVMNGLIPALAQDPSLGFGMGAGESAWWTLTPYAIAGLLMGPAAGWLAATVGYRKMLRIGMAGSVVAVCLMILLVGSDSRLLLLGLSILIGLTYAGTVNIILNGLGIVLSPKENPGFLPGLNAGAFNLGAGLSFAVIFAVKTALTPAGSSGSGVSGGYVGGLVAGLVFLALALATSFLIPRPVGAEAPSSSIGVASSAGADQ
ncbi:MAG: MFS transporter [Intrasporangium sp.]|uniref:uridine transporter UriT n=1 Tax=Intrasporangium sp. TaxID=1925024 RepID=UPI002647EE3B|nr:MFS transporter [Intrasporangium sp.]MDN5795416.1 MFS transporter [Intrasporangium sp.]